MVELLIVSVFASRIAVYGIVMVRSSRTESFEAGLNWLHDDLDWCGSAERVNVWGWGEGAGVVRRPSTREIRRFTALEPQYPRRSKRLLGIVRLHQASSRCIKLW